MSGSSFMHSGFSHSTL
jgi:hypothetical protein